MILLGALALIVIGPKQLPEVARTIGRFLTEIKRVTSDVTKTLVDARDSTDAELRNNGSPFHASAPPATAPPHFTPHSEKAEDKASANEVSVPESATVVTAEHEGHGPEAVLDPDSKAKHE